MVLREAPEKNVLWPSQYSQAEYYLKVLVVMAVGKTTLRTDTSSHSPVSLSLTLFPLDLKLLFY